MANFIQTCNYKLIYIFRINDEAHLNILKIGEATLHSNEPLECLFPNSTSLNKAAKKRIDEYTSTAAIKYELLHTELAVCPMPNGYLNPFHDKDVHKVLKSSGIKQRFFNDTKKANEWFETDLETAKKAIEAVKQGRPTLLPGEITEDRNPIIFRPEQNEAIEKTVARFKKHKKMLWNAKMRFGKTLAALQVIKRLGYKKTLIFTHRPVVDDAWFDDYHKIFYDNTNYHFGSKRKDKGLPLETLVQSCSHFIYFASIQDLRGSAFVGGRYNKNDLVFSTEWDCVIIDEAHEGTKTDLGDAVIESVKAPNTRFLRLSGTAFNLIDEHNDDEIFTWDYVMEQRAKKQWYIDHPGDPNPYESLPTLNIFTYDLERIISGFADIDDSAFNFREFFRTYTASDEEKAPLPPSVKVGDFVHATAIKTFLDLLSAPKAETNYPFSTKEYRENFRHTLWMLPGVKEAKALSAMLNEHPVFGSGAFKIVNVAGIGDDDNECDNALDEVRKAIGKHPEETYTITLSCGRLTTGVSVKEWTAVFMLAGSANTSASSYLQTIFRVQTPGSIGGKQKTECFVFDFAPDRTIQMVAEAAKISSGAGATTDNDREIMQEFLNFCPVISLQGSSMKPYDVGNMLKQLKKAYVERVVRSGFDDNKLYNEKLLQLSSEELKKFEDLRKIVGSTKPHPRIEKIDINKQGFTEEEYKKAKQDEKDKRRKKELTPEQKKRLEMLKEIRKNREKLISVLRGVSIRIPLLIYGAELKEEENITLQNLTEKVDDISWAEFMPNGVTKSIYRSFIKYYDPEIFEAAGVRIRQITRAADKLSVEERIARIAMIFSHFRNPDKETVLTPWRVVNMQLGDCLGGYNFLTTDKKDTEETSHFVDQGQVTLDTLANPNARILEINAKTGLYALYAAYSIYRTRISQHLYKDKDLETRIWTKTLHENIFIICRTKMSKAIVKRTLVGFTNGHVNVRSYDDLLMQIKNKSAQFIKRARNASTYGCKLNLSNMKFNAIIGNPPYQVNDGSGASSDAANPIYDDFFNISKAMAPDHISLIMPSRWMVGGKRKLLAFRETMMNNQNLAKIYDFEDAGECFPGQHIDGGLCYILDSSSHQGKTLYTYKEANGSSFVSKRSLKDGDKNIVIRDARRIGIICKTSNGPRFSSIVSLTKPYGIRKDLFNNPDKYKDAGISDEPYEGSVKIWGVKGVKGGASRCSCYISRKYIKKNIDSIDKYKLFFTTSYSTGAYNYPEIIIADPGTICTETFLEIGPFDTKEERDNCLSYMKTDFFKILLYFAKGTMQVNQEVFGLIPLLNFTHYWNNDIIINHYKFNKEDLACIQHYKSN